MFYRFPLPLVALLLAAGPVLAQAPALITIIPAANARAVPRNAGVIASFSQPLTAASATALKVYSSQRGGLRGGGTATVSGATLGFLPTAYDFRPGETVQLTVTRAAASTSGPLATARVQQFTTAVGGTGRGVLGGGSDLSMRGAYGVAAGDVDGDGDLDLVCANVTVNNLVVRLNGGNATGSNTGTFSGGQTLPLGVNPVAVVLADVDGDGDLDALVANYTNNVVSVCLNGGSATGSNTGVFTVGQTVGVGTNPNALATGDIDGDGDLDFVTANTATNNVSVYRNGGNALGTNTGQFAPDPDVLMGTYPYSVALADVDGDGDLDLLTANYAANSVSVRLNGGDNLGTNTGSFFGGQNIFVGDSPRDLALGDLDGDGDLDMVVANYGQPSLSVRLNGGDATGSNTGIFAGTQTVPVGDNTGTLALGDLDADGDLDVVAAGSTTATAFVRLNGGDATGSNTGVFGSGSTFALSAVAMNLALADVDGDADLDVLTVSFSGNTSSIRLNGGTGPLASAGAAPLAGPVLYPNPVRTAAMLTGTAPGVAVQVLDALGRVVATGTADATGTAALVLPAGLASGMYVVRAGRQTIRLAVE